MDLSELKQRVASLSPEQRAALEERLLARRAEGHTAARIPRREAGAECPLSLAQQRLWFLDQLTPGRAVYNEPSALRLEGALDVAALGRALDEIVARHEAVRTVFIARDGEPRLELLPPRAVDLDPVDLSTLEPAARAAALEAALAETARAPFDLTRDLMLRARLVRLAADEHVLLLVKHHIASDGWSSGVLLRELGALYGAFARGEPSPLPELPIQYGDFAVWQRRWLAGGELARQLDYWRGQLAGTPGLLELPADRPRPDVQTSRGARLTRVLPAALGAELKALARGESATLYMGALTGFFALLHRLTGQPDLLVASPIAGRTRLEVEPLIGFFVGTLALRGDLSGDPTGRQLLRRVRATALGAYANQDVPFEKLVEELAPDRSLRGSPLVQVMFALQSTREQREPILGDLGVSRMAVHTGTAKLDLSVYVVELADGLEVTAEYSTDLFDRDTVARWLGYYERLLDGIVRDPDSPLSALPLLAEDEERRLVVEWNDTAAEYPRDATLHGLFEAQARRAPDAVALVDGPRRVRYDELERRANRVAQHLRALGIGAGAVVGVCVPRSTELVAGILGVLKAGAAYLPLDPSYPPGRLQLMLEDARPAAVLATAASRAALPADTRVVCVDPEDGALAAAPDTPVPAPAVPPVLAYVIYTSGSTGVPKGVLGRHRGAVNRACWMWAAHPFAPDDVCCAKTSISFVDSVWELFGGLLAGRPTVLVPEPALLEPAQLLDLLAREGVTRIVLVPSLLETVLEAAPDLGARLPALRLWVSSGERLTAELAARFFAAAPGRLLVNLYGCSEVSADSTAHVLRAAPAERTVPIGRPIANTRVYLLDAHRRLVPTGALGELYVGGDGVALGYLGRDDLTSERFISDPWSTAADALLYRTGDLARYRPEGALEIQGRTDNQIKVRGNRVELEEIEAAIRRLPQVRSAAVTLVPASAPGAADAELAAFVVPAAGAALTAAEVRRHLRAQLPGYMVPRFVELVRELPLTGTGKVDRAALVLPRRPERAERPYARPQTLPEAAIAQIWEELLGVSPVGIEDSFFDLGGHSLLAVRMMHEVERIAGRAVPLTALFQTPTVRGLAEALVAGDGATVPTLLTPLREAGTRPPFFYFHGDPVGAGLHCHEIARGMDDEQPFYAAHPHTLVDGALPPSIEAMAADYIGAIRRLQPAGPYRLGGHCNGGTMAYEIARQLTAAGETVDTLVLIDVMAKPRGQWPVRRVAGALARLARLEPVTEAKLFVHLWRTARNAYWGAWQLPRRLTRRRRPAGAVPAARPPAPERPAVEDLPWEYSPRGLAYWWLLRAYVHRPYQGRVVLLVPEEERGHRPPDRWWALAREVEMHVVPGGHLTAVTRHAGVVAARMRESLERAEAGRAGTP